MRILPATIALSAVVHGAAIAWALTRDLEQKPVVSVPPSVEIEVVSQAPPPVEVALLARHSVVSPPAPPPPHAPRPSIATVQHPAASPETSAVAPEPAKPHSPFMGMREPKKPQPETPALEVPGDFMDRFIANSKPLQPRAIESEQIDDAYRSGEAHLHDPGWISNHSGEEIAAERQRTLAARHDQEGHELQHKGTGYEAKHAVFNGEVEADGTAHIDKKRRYDPTEIIMNRHNIDPYASNKRRMLDDTRDERYAIGKAYKQKQLANSAVIAQRNVAYLWAHTLDPAERKEALFEMWDECAETGSDELVAGGAAARKLITGFIAAKLTGPLAYTPAELAALNKKKKSSETFAPY